MCYPCSENKGDDQLRSYCQADLRLCFRLCRLLVSHVMALIQNHQNHPVTVFFTGCSIEQELKEFRSR